MTDPEISQKPTLTVKPYSGVGLAGLPWFITSSLVGTGGRAKCP
jgi:hypothetical protein